jgi:Ca-activated chloride channel family protein
MRLTRALLATSVALLTTVLVSASAGAQSGQEEHETATPESVVIFIMDLSGSMNEDFGNGRTKLDMAKDALRTSFEHVSDDESIGLRVYGDQQPSQPPVARQVNCETDTRVAVPVGQGDAQLLRAFAQQAALTLAAARVDGRLAALQHDMTLELASGRTET